MNKSVKRRKISEVVILPDSRVRAVLLLLAILTGISVPVFIFNHRCQGVLDKTGQPVTDSLPRSTMNSSLPVETTAQDVVRPLTFFDPNILDVEGFMGLGFSERQSLAIINYRNSMGGFRSAGDFFKSYVISDKMKAVLEPYVNIKTDFRREAVKLIEINTADSAALRKVKGIGQVLVIRIMERREELGGFHDKAQLLEIEGMSKQNFYRIEEQIEVDSFQIRKIDINFADRKILESQLAAHPYCDGAVASNIVDHREMKGGWSNIRELVQENIITGEQAEMLAPYFVFN